MPDNTRILILQLLTVATFLPLASSVVMMFLGKRLGKSSGWIATAVMFGSFVASFYAATLWMQHSAPAPIVQNIRWIPLVGMGPDSADALYLGMMVDGLTIVMMTMVTLIATLVHLYSVGYMNDDKKFSRFFSYLSLFSFSMLGIVISNSIIQLLVFWELVGLTSYLLIGFWFEKRAPQAACKKAFVMNRIGDMGFLIGFGILFFKLGGKLLLPAVSGGMFDAINHLLPTLNNDGVIRNPPMWLTIAGIGLFFGAIGKSAQFPLQTWLPDAMEGPTPVSSIVHSATMVAAGVYLTARIYPILTPGAHLFIATIGLITLVMAACMALVMTDIKRVLAYSTMSQLGYMILGLGCGSYSFALYHLITHAFFKCCLFQCSGSVIHAAHHEQDMSKYGGLGKKMPITMICYAVCTLAIAGASIPYTNIGVSGFYSKDGVIASTISYGNHITAYVDWGFLFYYVPLGVAYLTVFYMSRSFALTFLGTPRDQRLYDHAHEAPVTMLIPQVVLAVLAVVATPSIMPSILGLINSTNPSVSWVHAGGEEGMHEGFHHVHHALLNGVGWIIAAVAGIGLYSFGFRFSSKIAKAPGVSIFYAWFKNKFWFDGLYDVFFVDWVFKPLANLVRKFDTRIIDGIVNVPRGLDVKAIAIAAGHKDATTEEGGPVRQYVLVAFCSVILAMLAAAAVVMTTGNK
jgi:NADH-quinone oxidoreductase subunit L